MNTPTKLTPEEKAITVSKLISDGKTATYIFYREEGFYPISLPDADEQIPDHVKANAGTLRVDKLIPGKGIVRIWQAEDAQ